MIDKYNKNKEGESDSACRPYEGRQAKGVHN